MQAETKSPPTWNQGDSVCLSICFWNTKKSQRLDREKPSASQSGPTPSGNETNRTLSARYISGWGPPLPIFPPCRPVQKRKCLKPNKSQTYIYRTTRQQVFLFLLLGLFGIPHCFSLFHFIFCVVSRRICSKLALLYGEKLGEFSPV